MTKLPATGPHYLFFVDISHIGDRSSRYNYVSRPFAADQNAAFGRIPWRADAPHTYRVSNLQRRHLQKLGILIVARPTGRPELLLHPRDRTIQRSGKPPLDSI